MDDNPYKSPEYVEPRMSLLKRLRNWFCGDECEMLCAFLLIVGMPVVMLSLGLWLMGEPLIPAIVWSVGVTFLWLVALFVLGTFLLNS